MEGIAAAILTVVVWPGLLFAGLWLANWCNRVP